ncbi:hypothetical protein P8452_73792 [Trifolium repens]|nr:hypothetical protein P8452_73792 [Trifolium repens]
MKVSPRYKETLRYSQAPFSTIPGYPFLISYGSAMKAAGGVKMGAAAAAMTAAATAAMTGSKQEQTDASQQPSK